MAIVFKKRYPQNPISLSSGKGLRFDDTGDGFGYLSTDNQTVIDELNTYISDGRGGISVSTQSEYDAALKKKPTLPASTPSFLRENQTAGRVAPKLEPLAEAPVVASAVADGAKPAEPVAPPVVPTPKVGKRVPSKLP